MLVLSIFPGIGLLDQAFEEAGFCVVRGPDTLWGGDVRRFHPPTGVFWGVIGGPPCQDFSSLRREPQTGYGIEMLSEFSRIVNEAAPEWFLCENVSRVANLRDVTELSHTYFVQRLDINLAWYCDATRLRHIQFGSKSGKLIDVPRRPVTKTGLPGAALANDKRSFKDICRLQGLPDDFDLPGFLLKEKIRAVGNGVPIAMGRALAKAVIDANEHQPPPILQRDLVGHVTVLGLCACGCGRPVTGKQRSYDYACRKRLERNRKRDAAAGSQQV